MQHHTSDPMFFERRGVRRVLVVLVALFALSVVRAGVSVWLLARERDKLASELQQAEGRVKERSTQLEALSTGAGVEKALRSAFNIKKPDEQTIVILDPNPTPSPEQQRSRAWWDTIQQWLTPKQ